MNSDGNAERGLMHHHLPEILDEAIEDAIRMLLCDEHVKSVFDTLPPEQQQIFLQDLASIEFDLPEDTAVFLSQVTNDEFQIEGRADSPERTLDETTGKSQKSRGTSERGTGDGRRFEKSPNNSGRVPE